MPATSIIGAAGAYFAAGELSVMDWAVALMVGNSPRADLVAQHPQTREAVAIQIKTSRVGDFDIGTLAEREPSPSTAREWFVLVALQGPGGPPGVLRGALEPCRRDDPPCLPGLAEEPGARWP